jgi:hypothetical protein
LGFSFKTVSVFALTLLFGLYPRYTQPYLFKSKEKKSRQIIKQQVPEVSNDSKFCWLSIAEYCISDDRAGEESEENMRPL